MLIQISGLCCMNNLFIREFLRYFGKIVRISINRSQDLVFVLWESLSSAILALQLNERSNSPEGILGGRLKLQVSFCQDRFKLPPSLSFDEDNKTLETASSLCEGKTWAFYFAQAEGLPEILHEFMQWLDVEIQTVSLLKAFQVIVQQQQQNEHERLLVWVEFEVNVRPFQGKGRFREFEFLLMHNYALLNLEAFEGKM